MFLPSVFFASFLVLLCNGQNYKKSRSVWVEQGLVRGKIYNIDNKQVQIFRGIPYAESPTGDRRFRKSIKKKRWEREYIATEYGPPCIQFMDFHRFDSYSARNMQTESEDCLYLNIFSPYDSEDEAGVHPIIVWIHGGSFLAGSADTGIDMEVVARNFIFRGVTLVTVNYRLGPLGFMSVNWGNGSIEGNAGLYDIKLALEWIQRNIKQFNGDPNKVTIMGESAGAAAVSALAASPLTKGLVHQAIALSGSSMSGWAIHRSSLIPPGWDMNNIAEYLTCRKLVSEDDTIYFLERESPTEKAKKRSACNMQEAIPACLTDYEVGSLTPEQMLACFQKEVNFSSTLFRHVLTVELGVSKLVIDGELITSGSVELLKNARVPLLTGVARREWAHKRPEFYQFPKFINLTRAQCEDSVKKIIETAFVPRLSNHISNATLDLISNATYLRYMEDVHVNYEMPEVVRRLQDLEADIEFVSPCQREIDEYSSRGNRVYAYSFDYMPAGTLIEEHNIFIPLFGDVRLVVQHTIRGPVFNGPFHGLDHAFIFTQGYSSNIKISPFTKRDKLMAKMLTKMITNFVSKGNPSTEHFDWPIYYNETPTTVSLDLPPRHVAGPLHFPAPGFWNKEAEMLARYTVSHQNNAIDRLEVTALTAEERIQFAAYQRAFYVLWVLIVAIAVVLWSFVIYQACNRCGRGHSKPYDNLVIHN